MTPTEQAYWQSVATNAAKAFPRIGIEWYELQKTTAAQMIKELVDAGHLTLERHNANTYLVKAKEWDK